MQVKVYESILDMSGIGEEWLLDLHGNVLAKFFDGNLSVSIVVNNSREVTKGI